MYVSFSLSMWLSVFLVCFVPVSVYLSVSCLFCYCCCCCCCSFLLFFLFGGEVYVCVCCVWFVCLFVRSFVRSFDWLIDWLIDRSVSVACSIGWVYFYIFQIGSLQDLLDTKDRQLKEQMRRETAGSSALGMSKWETVPNEQTIIILIQNNWHRRQELLWMLQVLK